MKLTPLFFVLPVLLPSIASACACGCAEAAPSAVVASVESQAPARHALKGVVVDVLADKSALLVKHEEIPGVMKAMTMLLTVDAAALKAVKKGDAITGSLVKKTDGWWLEDVKPAANVDA